MLDRFLSLSIIPAVIVGAMLGLTSACSTVPGLAGEGDPAAADAGIARAEWATALPQAMSDEICGQDSVFRKCYPVSDDECRERARSLTVGCVQEYRVEIPAWMRAADTSAWGGKIGECAGSGMVRVMESRYPQERSADCQQALSEM